MSKPMIVLFLAATLALFTSSCVISHEQKYHLPVDSELNSLMKSYGFDVPYVPENDDDDDWDQNLLGYKHHHPEHLNTDELMSQAPADEKDEEETKQLPEELTMFKDYCIKSRDHVHEAFNKRANDAIKIVFKILMEESDESIKVDKDFEENPKKYKAVRDMSTEELMKRAEDESSTVVDRRQEEKVNKEVTPTRTTVANNNDNSNNNNRDTSVAQTEEQPKNLGHVLLSGIQQLVRVVVETTISFASSEAAKAIAKLKKHLTAKEVQNILEDSCFSLQDLKKELRVMLQETQHYLVTHSVYKREKKQEIIKVDIEKLSCATIGRVNLVSKICAFINAAGPALVSLLKD